MFGVLMELFLLKTEKISKNDSDFKSNTLNDQLIMLPGITVVSTDDGVEVAFSKAKDIQHGTSDIFITFLI